MKIKAIFVYPIKGLKGISVPSAELQERGFVNDRRYMLVDSHNTFVSQRTHPSIALLETALSADTILVSNARDRIEISLATTTEEVINVSLFEHTLQVTLVGGDHDHWFSEYVGEPVRLVRMASSNVRNKQLVKGPESTEVSLADGYPYLILGTASLAELNSRLDEEVGFNRFRANIIVETTLAHEEDDWESIAVGDSEMMVIKPCARCSVVTINQQTGVRSKEPLKTMVSYRQVGNKVYFGANAICMSSGTISIGDIVACR